MKKFIQKIWEGFLFLAVKIYRKILPCFLRVKTNVNSLEFTDFYVKIRDGVLELPSAVLNRLYPTYVLIRNLPFYPDIRINKMQEFKSLLKWKVLNFDYPVVLRNYPLGFFAKLKKFDKPHLALKLPPKVLSIDKSDFHISKKIRTTEEIVTVMPYVRKTDKKKLVRIPVIKRPLHKYLFSREQMKIFREKVGQQHKTSWINIQIFEIYDKFHSSLYANVRQTPGTKELECNLSFSADIKNPKKNYYLVIGQRRDTGQSVKAIVDPSDIKKDDNS